MEKEKIFKALRAMCNKLIQDGHEVYVIYLQGSQNYGLDVSTEEYQSDIDAKAFVYPSLEDLYRGKKISKTYETEYGQIEVKDLRCLPELLVKMNSTYLELLYTPYYICDDIKDPFRHWRDQLVEERKQLLFQTLHGTLGQKKDNLCNERPGAEAALKKFGGYDPKELHHELRLLFMMQMLQLGFSYEKVLFLPESMRESLINIKVHGVGSLETAVSLSKTYKADADIILNEVWPKGTDPIFKNDALNAIEEKVHEIVINHLSPHPCSCPCDCSEE